MTNVRTYPPSTVPNMESAAFIHERMRRIQEDVVAAESKIERIRMRIERDRRALLLWQARLSALQNESSHRR